MLVCACVCAMLRQTSRRFVYVNCTRGVCVCECEWKTLTVPCACKMHDLRARRSSRKLTNHNNCDLCALIRFDKIYGNKFWGAMIAMASVVVVVVVAQRPTENLPCGIPIKFMHPTSATDVLAHKSPLNNKSPSQFLIRFCIRELWRFVRYSPDSRYVLLFHQ